ncbi:type II toxin-antitoxin system RelE/ParE family toxin [Alcanivorax sp.]|uniref:type II toxin-antitoxin system RelE family toxin n=1 Tax=Alcanivorax sp. TaxID=1872427 RepID=UPI00261D5CE4|nr:type II toxin-antitoxin system RelE/ParE family toxin [Alcanivorax sp.]
MLPSAQKEWKKLDGSIREPFKKKLRERLNNPHVPKDKLSGMPDCYKIKLRSIGYRLVYKVIDERLVVQVVGAGRRDASAIYNVVKKRLDQK